ncbi:LrgB family protein [Acinetobacter indicus]|uniref:LrgB family protein n=1 Tax=Acinetobacter indicus TaxID=756892 RepID=UPI000CEBD43C|nr:LrgB family protein [Acinetobacter indicus]
MNLIASLCFIFTLLGYIVAKQLYRRYPVLLFLPSILVPAGLICMLLYFGIPYDSYMQYSHWIVWMLGPATVAFAIPIYEYRALIQRHLLAISMGIVIGMCVGVISAFYLAQLFQLNQETTYSLMARSISTPFAMELSAQVGGSVELVILFTMMTGFAGGFIADAVLLALKLNSHFAQGAALGNAAHGFGTSKAFMRHREEGVAACLSMVLAGIFMVIFGPALIHGVVRFL